MRKKLVLSLLLAFMGVFWGWGANVVTLNTESVAKNGRYEYTSPTQSYEGQVNKLRFELIESGAFYSSGYKRLSFRAFYLYQADGAKVSLEAAWFSGNNGKNYANMLDNNPDTYTAGNWSSGTEDDYFEINLPESVDLGGAFSFGFITENTTMNAKALRITLSYEAQEQYTFRLVNAPKGATATYNGNAIADGQTYPTHAFDPDLFAGSEVSGYYWRIRMDKATQTINLVYALGSDEVNPKALVDLVKRIGGEGAAQQFKFVLNPAISSKREKFVLGSEDGKVLIKGSGISALTTGLGWYLNNIAHINIAWNVLNERKAGEAYADLSNLPLPKTTEEHTTDAQYRYNLNYCTFGYSMTSWTWKRWQQEIDWMALHGINMPLQIVGLEEVWRRFLTLEKDGVRKYKYTNAEAKAFVPGPAFTAWWGMNNLEGWGGTGTDGWGGVQDDAWYKRQAELAQKIGNRQRELGMQPVLPGFSGMVPTNFTTKTGIPTDDNGGEWCGFQRPRIIDPTYAGFAEIAKDYYACLKEVMGESQYYSMDPFHEGGSLKNGTDAKYDAAYRAIFDAMDEAKYNAQWVIQQWQWHDYQYRSLNAVPVGKLIVLDLFSDGRPGFGQTAYAPQHAVFCAIPNFGGRSGLMGRLQNVTDNYFHFKQRFANIKGIGVAPEAIEQTPITYDLIFQLPWMNGQQPNLEAWVRGYAASRYGQANATAQEAWQQLRQSVLAYGADGVQGPIEDVWAARPNLNASPASTWGSTLNGNPGNIYNRSKRQLLIDATYKLLNAQEELQLPHQSVSESNYLYDLVEFGGGVMADYAYDLLCGIREAKDAAGTNFANDATYKQRRNAFLELIADVDKFKGTNLNFRLGKWTQEARDAAQEVEGATQATPDWYEFNNARTLITTWGDQKQNGGLKDYSYRSWQGLLKDYYLPRWKYFFDNNCNGTNYFFFEWNWAHGLEHRVGQSNKSSKRLVEGQAGYRYDPQPEGDAAKTGKELLNKYILPIQMAEGTYYAYRYLVNALTEKITLVAQRGESLDLRPYFGSLEGAVLMADFIEGTTSDLSRAMIKSDASDGAHTAKIQLADGTVLSFAVVINPAYNGTYRIAHKKNGTNAPLFIAYNEDPDNGGNKGYKLIATGTYRPAAQGDQLFTITPKGTGYTFSAQGKYLKMPYVSHWQHIMFSDDASEAGVYVMEASGANYKIKSTATGNNYVNSYEKMIFGNDHATKENLSTFAFTAVSTYAQTVSEQGLATLCLPFAVELPQGVTAYDVASADVDENHQAGVFSCTAKPVAHAGEVIKGGTPVILKAAPGVYQLTIASQETGGKTSLAGSLLRGNFTKQTLTQDNAFQKFILRQSANEAAAFYPMDASFSIDANSCWMEWAVPQGETALAMKLTFDQDDTNSIQTPTTSTSKSIYNLKGQRLKKPARGVNIINGQRIVMK